eukprot:COSAG01_NODE_29783_length_629_cov_414.415094_1_plen_63_part_10
MQSSCIILLLPKIDCDFEQPHFAMPVFRLVGPQVFNMMLGSYDMEPFKDFHGTVTWFMTLILF